MKIFRNNLYLLKMVYASDRKRILYIFFLALISTLKNIISVMFIKVVIDCIITYQSLIYLLLLVLIERTISFILSYFECLLQWEKCPISDSLIKENIVTMVYSKSAKIRLYELDHPEFYDKVNRAVEEAEQRPFAIIGTIERFLSSMLTIFSVSTILLILDWQLIFLSIISSLISILANMAVSKVKYKKNNVLTKPNRKIGYVRRLFFLPQYIEEMKANNYSGLLFTKLENGTEEYNEIQNKFQPQIAIFNIINNWQIFVINFGIVSFFVGKKIIRGILEAASFTSLIYASTMLSEALSNLFSIIPQMAEHSLFIDNLREILDYRSPMEPTEESKVVQKAQSHSIILDNVSFKYRSSESDIIKNISLRINKGEKIALVGENGAGKSTLVKLMLRLYDPQRGSLYFDDENYTKLDVESLRKEIAIVYQDFQSFAFSIGENVIARELRGEKDEHDVWEALKGSGLSGKVESLPDKLNTPLTNEFEENGTNFSGGESQKLAIAKAVYKDAGVVIMDEPSSSLDPKSEHEMYMRMFAMCKDKTLILISHRLYSTKMVDKIYYMESGSILESGSHEELIKQNGKYAALYNIQAGQYK